MENFFTRTLGWATKRNILKGSTAAKQRTKTWEELTELAEGLSKSKLDLAKDAIGDCAVTTTNMMGCMGIDPVRVGERAHALANPEGDAERSNYQLYDLDGLVNLFVQHISMVRPKDQPRLPFDVILADEGRDHTLSEYHFVVALGALEHCARRLGLSFEACQEHAWNEIKDRKGLLISGSFVKEKDIPATAKRLIIDGVDKVMQSGPLRADSQEAYLALFTAKLREHFSTILNPEAIGLYVTIGNSVGMTSKTERHPKWENIEAVTLIARLYLDLGDGANIVANNHSNISFAPTDAVAHLPDTGEYQFSNAVLEQIRQYHTMAGLADDLTAMGYFPGETVFCNDKKETFDNGVEFLQFFINGKNPNAAQYTAAVLV